MKKEPKVVDGKVAIIISGSIEPDTLANAINKALVIEGITGAVVAKVPDNNALPYAVQAAKNVDVIIAGTFIGPDPNGSNAAALASSLTQIGTTGKIPVVPAIASGESLLEAKAMLSQTTASWALSAATILNLKKAGSAGGVKFEALEEPVIKEKPVFTTTETSVDTLMECLRESLKVIKNSALLYLSN